MKNLAVGIAIIILASAGGCSTAGKPAPEKLPPTNILESSWNTRIYRADYGTTFRAAVDALRLIDESSAKLVKYDAGVIMFKKPNNSGTLNAKVRKIDEEKTHVIMSATNKRNLWFDGKDKKKLEAFFAELDRLLGAVSSAETNTNMLEEEQPASIKGATPSNDEADRDLLLTTVKEKLQLDESTIFLRKLSMDDLSLLAQRLQALDSASAQGKSIAKRCAACYIDLARLHHDNGQYSRSAEALKAAISIEPENALAHCNLGEIYKHLGLVDEAIRELNEAKTLNPELPDTYINLGIMYDDYINDNAKALEFYKKYLDLGGADKQVLGWINAIENGS